MTIFCQIISCRVISSLLNDRTLLQNSLARFQFRLLDKHMAHCPVAQYGNWTLDILLWCCHQLPITDNSNLNSWIIKTKRYTGHYSFHKGLPLIHLSLYKSVSQSIFIFIFPSQSDDKFVKILLHCSICKAPTWL